mgnify:FL=1
MRLLTIVVYLERFFISTPFSWLLLLGVTSGMNCLCNARVLTEERKLFPYESFDFAPDPALF